ncbi:tafazzin [[Candida] jaroonii]|uniref:Tafazzin n=1 Tax=[Candida] jaroonii TaxID=467808 RepID=A0ACA9YA85_9ASCO|nr:tafazzin [[Candida] jaroonii]
MSFEDVITRGEDFLNEYPRQYTLWNVASHMACLGMIAGSKFFLNLLYKPEVHNIENLDNALARARKENRGLLTVMNHMSVVDDPTFYAALPWRFHWDIDTIRWGFGADNICFSNKFNSYFFNLGKILGCKRFGVGPFQPSVDAAIRILSPDDTLDLELLPIPRNTKTKSNYNSVILQELNTKPIIDIVKPSTPELMRKSPFIRTKTSWFHVFPEGFVLQLEEPHSNSMRYFKWGVARLILEPTRAPVVLPIFSYGFEKIAPEDTADEGIYRYLPNNMGSEVHIVIGKEVDDSKLEGYRSQWRKLCDKYIDPKKPNDLSEELKSGKKAQKLRGEVAATLRQSILDIRNTLNFKPEDPRFKDPAFWKEYTLTEGKSDPSVKFIGKNWAIRRFQKHLPEYNEED